MVITRNKTRAPSASATASIQAKLAEARAEVRAAEYARLQERLAEEREAHQAQRAETETATPTTGASRLPQESSSSCLGWQERRFGPWGEG